jgi:DNA-binding LacI/PurR family transcriptional regulator
MSSDSVGKVDIRSVARKAKVSIATVSRVMNGVATVDPKLAKRVVKAAAELNYTPNDQARALVSGRSRLLGLIVSEITNPFFPELVQAFENAAVERGYEILIGSTNYSPARMNQCVRRMVDRRVEGVAVMTFGMEEGLLQELAARRMPVVSVGSTRKLELAVSIEIDYKKGIREAIQHLARMGHREISFISGPLTIRSARLRLEAYQAAMAEIGIRPTEASTIEGDHTLEGGYAAALQLFERQDRPTAVLCSNDMTAIGVLHAVSIKGLQVPRDLSIVGFDDIHMAQFTVPPLTSVRMSGTDLAIAACNALLQMSGPEAASVPKELVVTTELTVRQTTGLRKTAEPASKTSRNNVMGSRHRLQPRTKAASHQ